MNELIYFEKALQFLNEIGVETSYQNIDDKDGFLPGFLIKQGKIIIDKSKVKFHGDILHEAAHIAVTPANERAYLNGKNIGERKDAAAEEMMAIAWTYAACIYLAIDPIFVFHENGYKGGGAAIVADFKKGNYFGVPVLEWQGMTVTVSEKNQLIFPAMIKWMRD